MSKKIGVSRRDFLVSTSAAAVTAAVAGTRKAQAETSPQAFRSPAGSLIPYSRHELLSQGSQQRVFTGEHLSEIAFPLGGIGTGTVSLGGRGELRDWEIFNRPGKGKILPFSFVALWSRSQGGAATVKVVEAPLMPPYRGGFGYSRDSAEGLPRLQGARFTGTYPFAKIDFEDKSLPVTVSLEAFNPFVPLDVDGSSLPVAIFHYYLTSHSRTAVDVALAFSLLNAIGYDGVARLSEARHPGFGKNLTSFRQQEVSPGLKVSGLQMTSEKYDPSSPRYGSMALLTTSPEVSARTGWEEGNWWDPFQKWFDEFVANGGVHDSHAAKPSADGESNYATLASRVRLLPGESKTITFLLTWYFPMREETWKLDKKDPDGGPQRNYYSFRFNNAWEVGLHSVYRLADLEQKTRSFHKAFSSTLPPYVLDAVSSQASILRTNTCMLLEGKQFFAFEGCADEDGCCPLNCTHVWNYEQALAFLFPELDRSMRHTDFTANMRSDGSMAFRTMLPLGRTQWTFRPAADGQMGCVMKLYREWQISGDDAFLQELWPQAKRALEFAWIHWDADKDGLMEGQQHNTYDIEFYGPNPMMTTLYLGALRAGELMAKAVGDQTAAESYRQVREKGRRNFEQLWNGEFYIQQVPPASQIRPLEKYADKDWYSKAVDNGQIRYQFGNGCLSDQMLGQWFAEVTGLDVGLQPERIRQTLQSIYRYNFKHNFYDHPNTQRIYALNDEKGLVLCSWPKGGRPELPFVYSDEVWTGIEYQVAAHLIYEGLVQEGLSIVKGIRERYDGKRRNPWNEVECGSHYARALSSWSVLLALSGYRYSATERSLSFRPRLNPGNFHCCFVASSGWGVYRQQWKGPALSARVEVHHGELRLRRLNLADQARVLSSSKLTLTAPDGRSILRCKAKLDKDVLQVEFPHELVVPEGGSIALNIRPTVKT